MLRNTPGWLLVSSSLVTTCHCLSPPALDLDNALVSHTVIELLQHCQERADVGLRHVTSWLQQHQQQQGVLVLLANMQVCGDARGGHLARSLK
jgi:hypothetical protein